MGAPLGRGFLAVTMLTPVLLVRTTHAQVVEYYHLDSVGSVLALTSSAGAVVETHDYLPFGEELNVSPGTQPRRFAEKERDAETGLDYFGARYYRANTGRLTTVDPAMNLKANLVSPQRWNRYAYALNDPLRFIDPDGRDVRVACVGGSCTATVRAQIVADPNDSAAMSTADSFKSSAEGYWNSQTVTAPTGETITFDVQFTVVAPGKQAAGMDTLTVVNGTGRAEVRVWIDPKAAVPDVGTIYTRDSTNDPSGMGGIAPHETGHLMGLPEGAPRGTKVPYVPGPGGDIMHHGQPGNSARSAGFVLDPTNANSTVTRKP